jgi:hypothetical protein
MEIEIEMETHNFFPILLYSSFIFITNVISTFYKKYYIYCFLFFCLTITSLIFHYNSNIYTNILDKIFVFTIVFYGGYMLYNKTTKQQNNKTTIYNQIYVLLIVITFVSCIFLFFYGYYVKDYCYHPDKCVGDKYHSILHILTSLGHHLIIFL